MSNRAKVTAQRRLDSNSTGADTASYNSTLTSTSNSSSSRKTSSGSGNKQPLLIPHPRPQQQQFEHHDSSAPPSYDVAATSTLSFTGSLTGEDRPSAMTAHSSLLQPRVAVALGVAAAWHPLLFACRLLSIVPAIWWGLPSGLRLLAMLHIVIFGQSLDGPVSSSSSSSQVDSSRVFSLASACSGHELSFEARLRLTETLLATIWCLASGYLSFFFTDCLMSRWLLNYTPQATIVRLLTINALNGYLTSWVLYVTGGSEDPRLLLPAWIGISSTLTLMYHITQRKINIRKETSMSISIFSIASFISMVALLAQLHSNRSDYPNIPLVVCVRRVVLEAGKVALTIMEYGNVARDL
ncbi:N-glycosylation protein-domain-containing protein [Lasiosphaeria miniovina]|uniref:N-glycosylation protein-domain-containing protein n=1 Tax=Lasiosphaeria miniovina TaxID=1954250 RepID=A0AA40BGV3_9PEZI|nr:N-glycosylation protein-domain-containing protein [Lasiosphaeria miniovina]KAK0733718.1 N-glycosylation protein-domain-containing protein [Lasiosphaeria miniovina]